MTVKNRIKKKLEKYLTATGIEHKQINTSERGVIGVVIVDLFLGDHVLTSTEYINHLDYMKASDDIAHNLIMWFKYQQQIASFPYILKLTRTRG